MSFSFTTTASFTRTHARELAAKVAADLRQMQVFYKKPTDQQINNFVDELVELLVGGYLASVDYGFRTSSEVIVALSYTVRSDGTLDTNDRAGRVPVGADISKASWYSFLRKSSKWSALSKSEREKIEASIPVKRSVGDEPNIGSGNFWIEDKVYSSNGTSFTRRTLKS
jgi:hypothetical protein